MNLVNFKKNFSFSKKNSKTTDENNEPVYHSIFGETQFKYIKTTHSYHLVDPSPWLALASLGAFRIT